MGRRRAENTARRLLQEQGFAASLPICLRKLAAKLGISVVERPNLMLNDEPMSGLLLRREGQTICIVNKDHAVTRRRYTVAHEIAHFVLHPAAESYLDVVARSPASALGEDPKEIEANAFAAELLMPEELIREQVSEPLHLSFEAEERKIRELAKRFRVSRPAMTFRLLNLDLLEQ